MSSNLYIVILNYCSYKDTIECLESLDKQTKQDFKILLIDNDSPNNSIISLKNWLEDKSINYSYIDNEQVINNEKQNEITVNSRITFIKSPFNGGYSYGNNIGLGIAFAQPDCTHAWVLNNDTVLPSHSIEIIYKEIINNKSTIKTGLWGSKLIYYYDKSKIQAYGGIINKFFGTSHHYAEGLGIETKIDKQRVMRLIDYPVGASLLFSKEFIEDVGYLCEDYFLYYEECDIALRGENKGWHFDILDNLIVYHKEGASIGFSKNDNKRSDISKYYFWKNRRVFIKKFYPYFLPLTYIGYLGVLIRRFQYKDFKSIKILFKALYK